MPYQARQIATLLYINSQLETIDRQIALEHPSRILLSIRHELAQVKKVLQGEKS